MTDICSNIWQGVHVDYLRNPGNPESWESLGKVAGFGTSNGQPVALVELDIPFWAEGRHYFITVLTVHISSLRASAWFCQDGDL